MCNVKVKKYKTVKSLESTYTLDFSFLKITRKQKIFYGILNMVNILILDLEKTKN